MLQQVELVQGHSQPDDIDVERDVTPEQRRKQERERDGDADPASRACRLSIRRGRPVLFGVGPPLRRISFVEDRGEEPTSCALGNEDAA